MTVVDATKENFDELVGSGLVLVDVWAESCRPCVALGPHMEKIASGNTDLTVVKVDASNARRLVMSLQVRGLPTILLLQDGQEVARISEPNLTTEQVDAWLATALAELPAKEA
ncbi:MAG TPA: thioredoxin family protein [Pseudonocardiaceae bacterium]|nr:thioredoxin family protein [Pseudonocardiaceae bacterium]